MKFAKGFTLIELLVTIALVGILSVIGVSMYFLYTPKAQASEATQLFSQYRLKVLENMQHGYCALNGTESLKGKYGVLVIMGVYKPTTGLSCLTGCQMVYTFNKTGVFKNLSNEKVTADVLSNSKISKNVKGTTLEDRYLSPNFVTINPDTDASCNTLGSLGMTITDAGVSGNEVGFSNSTTPPVTPTTPPVTPTTPPVTPPTTPVNPDGSGTGGSTVPPTVIDSTPSPNGVYHFNSNMPTFVIAAGGSKRFNIFPAAEMGEDSDWDGASSGSTGFTYKDSSGSVNSILWFEYHDQPRSNPQNYLNGYWKWPTEAYYTWSGLIPANSKLPGVSGNLYPTSGTVWTVDNVDVKVIGYSARTLQNYPVGKTSYYRQSQEMYVQVTNRKASAITLSMVYGQQATMGDNGGYVGHGVRGGSAYGTDRSGIDEREWNPRDGWITVLDK